MNEKRKRVNRAGHQVVRNFDLGRFIIHEIETVTLGLFQKDGTHLTQIGNAIFLTAIQEAIRLFFQNPSLPKYDAN